MIARTLLLQACERLQQAGCEQPRLDAECLLAHAWNITRTTLYMRMTDTVPQEVIHTFLAAIARRQQREPLAYITGEREFWSRSFLVNQHTLIPRPETEHLIEAVLRHMPQRDRAWHGCDIGTGSGCIAITLACEYPRARLLATDISHAALRMAQRNARQLQVHKRLQWLQADRLTALHDNARFALIIANPPYVARHEMAQLAQELRFEPEHALTDQADGLSHLRDILQQGAQLLSEDGLIIVETGTCGLPPTPAMLALVEEIRDLAGLLRGGVYRRL